VTLGANRSDGTVAAMGEQPEGWSTQDSREAGPCMTCGRDGLVVVRNDVRLCFTCAVDAGKAAVVTTGFVRPKRGNKDR